MAQLATCQWIHQHQNLVLTGATGCGKTWLACACLLYTSRCVYETDTDKAPYGLTVVDRILNPFIRQAKALLGDIHPQHPTQPKRRPTPATPFRIKRGDCLLKG